MRALLCDIDGVLRHWPGFAEIEEACGLPQGALAATAFAEDRLIPAIIGAVTDEQWRAGVAAALTERFGADTAQTAVAAWSAQRPRVDVRVADLLRRARKVMTVALVSNATSRLAQDLKQQGIDDVADFVVNTSRLGFAKPDPRVFEAAARVVGAPYDQCLFVDDTPTHVAVAQGLGMRAVHFRTFADLRDAINL